MATHLFLLWMNASVSTEFRAVIVTAVRKKVDDESVPEDRTHTCAFFNFLIFFLSRIDRFLPIYKLMFVFSVYCLISRRCHNISTMYPLASAPYETVLSCHHYRGNDILYYVYYVLKSSIFIVLDVLLWKKDILDKYAETG